MARSQQPGAVAARRTDRSRPRAAELWPRPERLLPPRLVDALVQVLAGETARAAELVAEVDPGDPLGGGVARLVQGMAALARGDLDRARAALRVAARDRDAALALVAVQALVEQDVAARRFAAARPILRRLRRRARHADVQLYLEALQLWVEVQRRGTVKPAVLEDLAGRLERSHPAAVHAAVQLLRAERALLAGDLAAAVAAQREARPYVQAAGHAGLRRRLDAVVRLLGAPFVEVEDWEAPLRPLSREELAELESRPWTLWIDTLHRRVLHRAARAERVQSFADAPEAWNLLETLVRAPRRRLGWSAVRGALDLANEAAARAAAERLAKKLGEAGIELVLQAGGPSLLEERFVFVFPLADLPPLQRALLAHLATRPGARAAELAPAGVGRRTVVHHLSLLREAGVVRLVGGGNEARYYLV